MGIIPVGPPGPVLMALIIHGDERRATG